MLSHRADEYTIAPMAGVVLEAKLTLEDGGAFLIVEARNDSAQPVTMVAHPRYFKIEVEDEVGQFVSDEASQAGQPSALPRPTDYTTIAPLASHIVARFPFERADRGVKARVRVTYKAADRVMPNLPREKRQSFFAGPVDVVTAWP